MDTRLKILSPEAAQDALAPKFRNGSRIAVARGSFQALRSEHIRRLAELREKFDSVIVLIVADREDGSLFPPAGDRAQLAAALGSVDHVVICDETAARALVEHWSAHRPEPVSVLAVEGPGFPDLVEHVLQRHRSQ